jgi:hypothetical protein
VVDFRPWPWYNLGQELSKGMRERETMSEAENLGENWARKLWVLGGTPLKVGLAFAILAALLVIVGWFVNPNFSPRTVSALVLAILISAVTWGLVSWAIASAVSAVDEDLKEEAEE